jgi:hypothetical protein
MEIIEIDITKEISGKLYGNIIDYAVGKYPFFVLILDLRYKSNERSIRVIEELSRFLVKSFCSSEWPGTKLLNEEVEVFHYNLTEGSANVLKKCASSFYQWQFPELPEDLSIMRNSDQPWLCNIAHEKVSMLYVSQVEKSELLNAMPELSGYFGEEGKPAAYY